MISSIAAVTFTAVVAVSFYLPNAGTNDKIKNNVKETDNAAEVQRKQLIEKVNAVRPDVRVLKQTPQGGLELSIAATTSKTDTKVNKSTLGIIRTTRQEIEAQDLCIVNAKAGMSDGNQFNNLKSVTSAAGSSKSISMDDINIERSQDLKATESRVQLLLHLKKCQQNARS